MIILNLIVFLFLDTFKIKKNHYMIHINRNKNDYSDNKIFRSIVPFTTKCDNKAPWTSSIDCETIVQKICRCNKLCPVTFAM